MQYAPSPLLVDIVAGTRSTESTAGNSYCYSASVETVKRKPEMTIMCAVINMSPLILDPGAQ